MAIAQPLFQLLYRLPLPTLVAQSRLTGFLFDFVRSPKSFLAQRWRTFTLERKRASAILPRSDWGVPASRAERGRKVKRRTAFASLSGFDIPTITVRENGTYGGQGKAVGCVPPTALLFVRQTMIDPLKWKYKAQAGLLVSAIAGTGFGTVIAYQAGSGWLGTFIWALIGAVVVGGAFYFDWVSRWR
jgi:hypothetical protein